MEPKSVTSAGLAAALIGPLLPLTFYGHDAATVARELLGKVLVRHGSDLRFGRIVETEAYLGEGDMASHARFGRTKRTEVMYGPAGRTYVYLIYGLHHMLNVVCAGVGDPQAVLIRSVVPLGGITSRADGPGRLCRALSIDLQLNNLPLTTSPLSIHSGSERVGRVVVTPRIGIDYAGEWRDAPLRFLAE